MASDEEKVRAVWQRVFYSEGGLTPAGPSYVTISHDDHPTAGSLIFMKHGASKAEVFAAAWVFTEHRLKEIRLVREEIALLETQLPDWCPAENIQLGGCHKCRAWSRILAREQAHLATLLKGMKAIQDGAAAREGNGNER